MRVNFYATLRETAGGKAFDVDTAKAHTARSALECVTAANPTLASEIWQVPGELKEHIHLFINGRESRFLPQGLDTPVGEQDTLDVFPPVGGGLALGTR